MRDAACAGKAPNKRTNPDDPDPFFPERGEPMDTGKKICIGCTVRVQCKQYRDKTGSTEGMWGAEILPKESR